MLCICVRRVLSDLVIIYSYSCKFVFTGPTLTKELLLFSHLHSVIRFFSIAYTLPAWFEVIDDELDIAAKGGSRLLLSHDVSSLPSCQRKIPPEDSGLVAIILTSAVSAVALS